MRTGFRVAWLALTIALVAAVAVLATLLVARDHKGGPIVLKRSYFCQQTQADLDHPPTVAGSPADRIAKTTNDRCVQEINALLESACSDDSVEAVDLTIVKGTSGTPFTNTERCSKL